MDFRLEELFTQDTMRIHRMIAPANEMATHLDRLQQIAERIIYEKTLSYVELTMAQRGALKLMAEWLCGNGKPQCGVMLIGSVGTGKTTLMQSLVKYYNWYYKKVIREVLAKTLPKEIRMNGIESFYKRPLFIDDLGKESAITAEFGQRYDTWGDIFSVRYELRSLTFATANYRIDGGFKEMYGEVINDRMKEHFNIIELTGESLRK